MAKSKDDKKAEDKPSEPVVDEPAVDQPAAAEKVAADKEAAASVPEETTSDEPVQDDISDIPLEELEAEAKTKVLDIEFDDDDESHVPDTPKLGKPRKGAIKKIHALGDLHGWAPGLINYLISNKLATIDVDGQSLGANGKLDHRNITRLFGRTSDMTARELPPAGLSGRPGFEGIVNGDGHSSIRARWIASDDTGFIQIGDVFDRSDHGEVAAEILRQLIIDAPDRVFTLVGNHEQFMLEDEFESWHMNEIRNAVTDHRDMGDDWKGRHLRFLSTEDLETEDRMTLVFAAYTQSTRLLYLTQAAAQQKALGIDHGLERKDIAALLSPGWEPYLCADSIAAKFEKPSVAFPGATVALVFGDTLFHHAEPDHRRTRLHEEMKWEKQPEFGWVNYIHGGGDLQKSPHSLLLWPRGASNGAASGSPQSQSLLTEITVHWPGLYRIVHGHTPTPGLDEFSTALRGEASTTSYLAESQGTLSQNGRASKIRVFNIDEGMAPTYYAGHEDVDDPLRIPVGLRMASAADWTKPILVHSTTDDLLVLERGRDVRKDTRKLWKWPPGTNRSGLTTGWHSIRGKRWAAAFNFDGVHWLVETTEEGHGLLSRRITEYDITRNVLLNILICAKRTVGPLKKAKLSPYRNALSRVNYEGGKPHLAALQDPKESWKVAENLEIFAIGHMPGVKKNTRELLVINGTDEKKVVYFTRLDGKKKGFKFPAKSVYASDVSYGGDLFAIHLENIPKKASGQMKEWLGEKEAKSVEPPELAFIAHYPSGDGSGGKPTEVHINTSRHAWKPPKPTPPASKDSSSGGKDIRDSQRGRDIRDEKKPIDKKQGSFTQKAHTPKQKSPKENPNDMRFQPPKGKAKDIRDKPSPTSKKPSAPAAQAKKKAVESQSASPPSGKSGSPSSNDQSSAEEPSPPAPEETTSDEAVQDNITEITIQDEKAGWRFIFKTNQIRELFMKKLPDTSNLKITIERVSPTATMINVFCQNNLPDKNRYYDHQLKAIPSTVDYTFKASTNSRRLDLPFSFINKPKPSNRNDGINPKLLLDILHDPIVSRLIELAMAGKRGSFPIEDLTPDGDSR